MKTDELLVLAGAAAALWFAWRSTRTATAATKPAYSGQMVGYAASSYDGYSLPYYTNEQIRSWDYQADAYGPYGPQGPGTWL